MKRLLSFLYLLPILSFSQDIPRNANAFLLTGITKNQVRQALVQQGFAVVDHDSSSFVTLPKQFKKINKGNMIITVQQKDTVVIITGTYNSNDNTMLDPNGNVYWPIVRSRGWSYCREFFEKLNTIVLSISPKVTYSKL